MERSPRRGWLHKLFGPRWTLDPTDLSQGPSSPLDEFGEDCYRYLKIPVYTVKYEIKTFLFLHFRPYMEEPPLPLHPFLLVVVVVALEEPPRNRTPGIHPIPGRFDSDSNERSSSLLRRMNLSDKDRRTQYYK